MLTISIVIGNPKRDSRTAAIAVNLVRKIFDQDQYQLNKIELSDFSDEILRWPSQKMADLGTFIADSDVVIFASPTYKATYTGLLKTFLDRYPANGLSNIIALPLMTGADFGHSMAPNTTLVPLLLELGAIVPVGGLYFNTSLMGEMDQLVIDKAAMIKAAFSSLHSVFSAAITQDAGNIVEAL